MFKFLKVQRSLEMSCKAALDPNRKKLCPFKISFRELNYFKKIFLIFFPPKVIFIETTIQRQSKLLIIHCWGKREEEKDSLLF